MRISLSTTLSESGPTGLVPVDRRFGYYNRYLELVHFARLKTLSFAVETQGSKVRIKFAADRRPPSKLGEIQPDHWLAEYKTELLNVLNVLTMLVELEPEQAKLLEAICDGPTICLSPDHRPAASRRRGS